MQLLSFEDAGRARLGVRRGESVVDLARADADLPESWPEIFEQMLLSRVAEAAAAADEAALRPLDAISFLPPIPRPPKILAIGLNYHDHAHEVGLPIPDELIVFPRTPLSFVGHKEPMIRPKASSQFDYEGELVAVIGKAGRHIAEENALSHVVGYAVGNDGSLRDYQFKTSQWMLGKTFDASGSWGPYIVTQDEVAPGAAALALETRLNGDVVQSGNTKDMIFSLAQQIALLSEVMTLEPGDVILTGTPAGVGVSRKPQLWMQPGDRIDVTIDGVGHLENPIEAER